MDVKAERRAKHAFSTRYKNKGNQEMGQRTLAAIAALSVAATGLAAQEAGTITVGLGVAGVFPKDDNGSIVNGALDVDVQENYRPIATAEYFIYRNVGIELLASWPFEHDIEVGDLGEVASTKHLPPTLSLQYHFNGGGSVSPFLGAGINYTFFFDEDTSGALAGSDIELDPSFGYALHAGVDFAVGERGAVRADIRYIDIDTDLELDGEDVGEVEIDPIVAAVSYVYTF